MQEGRRGRSRPEGRRTQTLDPLAQKPMSARRDGPGEEAAEEEHVIVPWVAAPVPEGAEGRGLSRAGKAGKVVGKTARRLCPPAFGSAPTPPALLH